MRADDVLGLYHAFERAGVPVWIDGGWCVDALLGRQTRPHGDLDLAVERRYADRLHQILTDMGYLAEHNPATTPWNYVLTKEPDHSVDIHVFEHDADGRVVYGIEYPAESLTGTGTIAGEPVRCIAPKSMFEFKTAYPPAAKDREDVHALAAEFGIQVPESHK